jgi:hypothetical protein
MLLGVGLLVCIRLITLSPNHSLNDQTAAQNDGPSPTALTVSAFQLWNDYHINVELHADP